MTPDARAAALALCEAVEAYFDDPSGHQCGPTCGCPEAATRALRAALAAPEPTRHDALCPASQTYTGNVGSAPEVPCTCPAPPASERDRLADFLDDKAGACAGAELAAENTEQAFVAQVEETMFRAAAAALRATPSEPSEARYEVVIRWSWSRYGFHEENRYHIDAPASADKVVRSLCKRVADRYGFDCGRLDQPLNPYVSSVRVVRIGTETPLDTTPFNAHLDECVEDFRVRAVRAATVRAKETK